MRKVFARQHLAQRANHFRVAVKIRKRHNDSMQALLSCLRCPAIAQDQAHDFRMHHSNGGRASTSTTRCGSRLAISRNASRTRVKKA